MSEVVFYPGFGRPCPDCKCFFNSNVDFALHRRVCPKPPVWKPSTRSEGVWWILSNEDLNLKNVIVQNGKYPVIVGDFECGLSPDEKVIWRRHI